MRRHGRQAQVAKASSSPDALSPFRAYDIASNPTRPLRSSPLTASTIQGLPLEIIDRLRSFPLFASAPEAFLGAIGKSLRPQLHQPHAYILTEGEDARSMYWLVRGSVRVTSRDGESTYAELKPGAFFGEIGILMDIPRTATITASTRSLVVRLAKEDLQKELPKYPSVERAIREEAVERLAILEQKKKQGITSGATLRKRSRDYMAADVEMGDATTHPIFGQDHLASKKRKSPSPTIVEAASTAFGNPSLPIRHLLQTFPLFSNLPPDILHFLGVYAQPCTFPPFTDIIQQGSQGRDVYFVVQGEVEVLTDANGPDAVMSGVDPVDMPKPLQRVRARFGQGQYFGEVASLFLAPKRTATVRTIDLVECLRITGEVLDELWRKASPDVRQHMESEARRRLDSVTSDRSTTPFKDTTPRRVAPAVTFTDVGFQRAPKDPKAAAHEPMDPDPFFGSELEVPRQKSRRSSLAPPEPDQMLLSQADYEPMKPSPLGTNSTSPSSSSRKARSNLSSAPVSPHMQPVQTTSHQPCSWPRIDKCALPDHILLLILHHFDILQLMHMRLVSRHWHQLCTTNDTLLHHLDLAKYNRYINDQVLISAIAPFAGNRPRFVDLDSCFHVTDEGFSALATACAHNVRVWKMKSVWDVTGNAILELVSQAPYLEEIDLSNCRKVGDNLLARIIGQASPQQSGHKGVGLGIANSNNKPTATLSGTGSPNLKRLTLSYCKHVQDRSMTHIAQYAAERLEVIDLTRCTSITDNGFKQWGMHTFPNLHKLILADCTYLSDQSVVAIVNSARNLRELDLVRIHCT